MTHKNTKKGRWREGLSLKRVSQRMKRQLSSLPLKSVLNLALHVERDSIHYLEREESIAYSLGKDLLNASCELPFLIKSNKEGESFNKHFRIPGVKWQQGPQREPHPHQSSPVPVHAWQTLTCSPVLLVRRDIRQRLVQRILTEIENTPDPVLVQQ